METHVPDNVYSDCSSCRVREISFNLPEQIPSITDYFNTVNMSVLDLHSMLTKVNLQDEADLLWNKIAELSDSIDAEICDVTSRIRSAKIRNDIFQRTCSILRHHFYLPISCYII